MLSSHSFPCLLLLLQPKRRDSSPEVRKYQVVQVLGRVADQLLPGSLYFISVSRDVSCPSVVIKLIFRCHTHTKKPSKEKNNNCMGWQVLGVRSRNTSLVLKTAEISQLKLHYLKRTKFLIGRKMKHIPGPR